ncbi:MAG: hypothetical protein H3C69_09235 [Candidatus Promineofilum sp.]|nr:hypothetical protein [Promineifilum sp.]
MTNKTGVRLEVKAKLANTAGGFATAFVVARFFDATGGEIAGTSFRGNGDLLEWRKRRVEAAFGPIVEEVWIAA